MYLTDKLDKIEKLNDRSFYLDSYIPHLLNYCTSNTHTGVVDEVDIGRLYVS